MSGKIFRAGDPESAHVVLVWLDGLPLPPGSVVECVAGPHGYVRVAYTWTPFFGARLADGSPAPALAGRDYAECGGSHPGCTAVHFGRVAVVMRGDT